MRTTFMTALCMMASVHADLQQNLTNFIIDAAAARNTRETETKKSGD